MTIDEFEKMGKMVYRYSVKLCERGPYFTIESSVPYEKWGGGTLVKVYRPLEPEKETERFNKWYKFFHGMGEKKIEITNEVIPISPNEPMVISINFQWICENLLKKFKRTKEGLITDEALSDACMELSGEEKK